MSPGSDAPRMTTVSESPRPDALRGVVIFLHGWTGDEHSMEVLDAGLAPGWWRLAPRAPFPAPPGGYSWSSAPEPARASPEAFLPASEALRAFVEQLEGVDAVPLVLVGFSQGSAVGFSAIGAGLLRPTGLAVLSGFLPEGGERSAFTGLPVFWSHGMQDELVRIDRARADVRRLEQAGARVTYCEASVGHKVGLPCVRGLRAWLMDLEQRPAG